MISLNSAAIAQPEPLPRITDSELELIFKDAIPALKEMWDLEITMEDAFRHLERIESTFKMQRSYPHVDYFKILDIFFNNSALEPNIGSIQNGVQIGHFLFSYIKNNHYRILLNQKNK